MCNAHLEPACVEEELQQGSERHVHVQVPQLGCRLLSGKKLLGFANPCFWLHKLAAHQGESEEGIHSYGHHLEKRVGCMLAQKGGIMD